MHRSVKQIVRTCEICQMAKMSATLNPPLQSIVPTAPNNLISLDLFGPLPVSVGGVTFLCVFLDVFTKFVCLYPLKRATTSSILNRLRKDYIPKAGKPERILTDHGTQFTSGEWREGLRSLSIEHVKCSVRHAQANPVERVMRELGRLFRVFCYSQHTRWALEVPRLEVFLNSVVHETTGYSPIELHLGRTPEPVLPFLSEEARQSDNHVKLFYARESFISRAAKREARHPGRPYISFNGGDLVLLRSNPMSSAVSRETKKFMLLFEGPYRIKKKIGPATYVLTGLDDDVERGTFHASHLKPFCKPEQ